MKNTEENNGKVGKISQKIVKRYGKYGGKAGRKVIRYEIWKKIQVE